MSLIELKKDCEIHNKKIYNICLNKKCNNRFLCINCFRNHEKSHSTNYVPIKELIDNENNIILFNEYKKTYIEENNELLSKKKEILDEMNKRVEELRKDLEKKIIEIFDKLNPLYEKLQNINKLSLDEISLIYERFNTNNIKENKDVKIDVESFGELLKSRFSEIVEKVNEDDIYGEIFKFKFKEGTNYIITNFGSIATKNEGGNTWNCTVIGNREIRKNKISRWKIRLNNFEIKHNSWNILIGIGPENINNETQFYVNCWSFICGSSQLSIKSANTTKYLNHSGKLKKGDIVGVVVDREKGTLSFAINDVDYGIACNNIPLEDKLYPIVLINDVNQTVELLD